jgi:hypothetical protein
MNPALNAPTDAGLPAKTPPAAGRKIKYREALNEALREEMERDASVFIMGEGIANGAALTR